MVKQCLWVKIRCYFPESISSNSFKILEISTCGAHLLISRRLHRPAPRRWRHGPRALASSCPAQPGKANSQSSHLSLFVELNLKCWVESLLSSCPVQPWRPNLVLKIKQERSHLSFRYIFQHRSLLNWIKNLIENAEFTFGPTTFNLNPPAPTAL